MIGRKYRRWREKQHYICFVRKRMRLERRMNKKGKTLNTRKTSRRFKRYHKNIKKGVANANTTASTFSLNPEEECIAHFVGKQDKRPFRKIPGKNLVIVLPEIFDLEDNYNQSALVFQVFRRALRIKKRIVNIDFTKMRTISPACIVTFASYVELWKKIQKAKPYPHFDTWQSGIRESFTQMGFFETVGMKNFSSTPQPHSEASVQYMGIESFEVIETGLDVAGERVKNIRHQIEEFVEQKIEHTYFYPATIEAILNIHQHAYTHIPQREQMKKWWISIGFDRKTMLLHILILDHGAGIPNTLIYSKKFNKLLSRFPSVLQRSDATKLKLAFEKGPNRAKMAGRGHGLSDIVLYPKTQKQSSLVAWSGKGCYSVAYQEGKQTSGKSISLPHHFQGTLLELRIQL